MIWPTDDDAVQITKDESGLIVAPRQGAFELLIGGTDYYSQEAALTRTEVERLQQLLWDWLYA